MSRGWKGWREGDKRSYSLSGQAVSSKSKKWKVWQHDKLGEKGADLVCGSEGVCLL